MVGLNKNILRVILISSYIIIIALLVSGISSIFSYLNTGADRNKMLHTDIKKIDQYLPKIVWSPLANEGRPMDFETLKNIENDYLDAWYVRHLAYQTNSNAGIKDYYTDSARENLNLFIQENTTKGITIKSTTLEHHPSLEFFSEDGQMVVITDNNVTEYKQVFKDGNLIHDTNEQSNYKAILLLEDGFWRIRHFIKETAKNLQQKKQNVSSLNLNIKGINYYPQDTPWDMFGEKFSKDIILKDFKVIKDAGLNSVRIFVPYDDFGKANVNNEKLYKLKEVLDAAEETGIKVVITLFDFYGDYSVLDWTLNQRHAETIVSHLKNHNALIAWDIKNEPNLDFESRGKDLVIAWASNMVNLVKSIDNNHPVTIGWSNNKSAIILKDKVDFVSFHYYEDLDNLESNIKILKEEVADKPIVMQEFGLSSYSGIWNPFGASEKQQAEYHNKAQEIIANNNLQYMSWTLYDFDKIPKEVVGRLPWRKNAQKQFGFIDKNGTKKASFKYISKD